MTGYRLRSQAVLDLEEIGRFTQRQWGVTQRRKYLARLVAKFGTLAARPKLGIARDDLRPGYRCAYVGQHVIFFRLAERGIEVVRILHSRMDLDRRIADDEAPDRTVTSSKRQRPRIR